MSKTPNQSAVHRLRELPDVFTLGEVSLFLNMDINSVYVTLSRWKAERLIEPLAPRSKVYINLIRNIENTHLCKTEAVLRAYPSAILMGGTVLHNAGWTTQITKSTQIAVLKANSYLSIPDVELIPRPSHWFKSLQDEKGISSPRKAGFPTYGYSALLPEFALIDLYLDPKAWHPDPDDLQIPEGKLDAIEQARQVLCHRHTPEKLQWLYDDSGYSPEVPTFGLTE